MSLSPAQFCVLLNFAVLGVFIVSSNLINTGSLEVGPKWSLLWTINSIPCFSFMLFALVFSLYPRASCICRKNFRIIEGEEPSIHNEAIDTEIHSDKIGTLSLSMYHLHISITKKPVLHDITFSANGERPLQSSVAPVAVKAH